MIALTAAASERDIDALEALFGSKSDGRDAIMADLELSAIRSI